MADALVILQQNMQNICQTTAGVRSGAGVVTRWWGQLTTVAGATRDDPCLEIRPVQVP